MSPRRKSVRITKLNFQNQYAKKSPQWGSYVVRKSAQIPRPNSSSTVEDIPQWGSCIVHESSSDLPSSSDEETVKRKITRKKKYQIAEILKHQSTIRAQVPKNRPPKELTQREKLLWIQRNRTIYYWVKCSNLKCQKWRLLKYIVDPNNIANNWVCNMNQEEDYNSCETPQMSSIYLQKLIDIRYNIGSIVMAKLPGCPWWPAMIDDDPQYGEFYWLNAQDLKPSHYHVIYFDKKVNRQWHTIKQILPFNDPSISMSKNKLKKYYKKRLTESIELAKFASKMDIAERLEKFSFVSRYKGPIYSYKHNLQEFARVRNLPPYVDTDDENEEEQGNVEKKNIYVQDENLEEDVIITSSSSSSDYENEEIVTISQP